MAEGSALDRVEGTAARLRGRARETLGITEDNAAPPLREVVRGSGVGWYPLLAIGLLVVVDEFFGFGLAVLGPEITNTLGISKAMLAAIISAKLLAVSIAMLPMAAYVQERPRRAALSIGAAFGWSAATVLAAFVVGPAGLLIVVLLDGATSGSVRAVHQPLLLDYYPPEARYRTMSWYTGALVLGSVISPLFVGLLTTTFDLTWRGVFLAMGIVSFAAAVLAVRLRDPGFGRWDTDRVRALVHEEAGPPPSMANPATAEGPVESAEVPLRFFDVIRRLQRIPTVRRALVAQAVLGVLIVPYTTFLLFFLDEEWGLGPGARALFFAGLSAVSVVAVGAYGSRGEDLFRRDPPGVIRLASLMLGASLIVIVAGALVPWFVPMVLFFAAAAAMNAMVSPAVVTAMMAIVPARMRPHLAALAGIYLAGVGGFAGALLLSSVDRRFGTGGALVSIAVPGVVGAAILRSAADTVDADLDAMLDEIVEEEEVQTLRAEGAELPILACRGIDFSYGRVQVLFGVDFSLAEGEMVALLGTNGAGKSTLLRVISGLGLPDRGSVRLRGREITWIEAERRAGLGVMQVPGGKAVFGDMTVVENLRVYGHVLGRKRAVVERGIEEAFDAFPRLAERRSSLASTLSGGEQQMVALSKALIVPPELLLIDELSLGLAPKAVGSLLDMVREINHRGTSVVLVEQSVNVALSLVDHAYFMERGEIRFDGPARDLLGRTDLLRSVFLEGSSGHGDGAQ